MTSSYAAHTDFTKDVLGRYVYNGLDEALASTSGGGRPFDIVIIGAGAFGSTLAHRAFRRDVSRSHRILVLDAGPHVLSGHVENHPGLGLCPPAATTTDPGVPRAEVWGLPWRSDVAGGFPGLAYCVGGRSIFWGGWAPELLAAEMPPEAWPEPVRRDLGGTSPVRGEASYFTQAAELLGVAQPNHFASGPLHDALRQQVFEGIQAGALTEAVPLDDIPLHLDPLPAAVDPDLLKLEAPLAVHGGPPRAGYGPVTTFSAVSLLMRAAREAHVESGGDDRRKRLMVVPNCHVTTLDTAVVDGVGRITAVRVGGGGSIPVPEHGVVVLAVGTIESTRLALASFEGTRSYDLIGSNLLSHARSNHTFRVSRRALAELPADGRDLDAAALFVRGRTTHRRTDGSVGHFHLQITANGCAGLHPDAEAELRPRNGDDGAVGGARPVGADEIVVTLRGVGELQAHNPANRITLSDEVDEYGVRRAVVTMGDPGAVARRGETMQTTNDRDLWDAMDRMADEVRAVIVGGLPGGAPVPHREGLGTTHHEAGTLWMGTDPAASVTTPDGRFHHVVNAYALGPSTIPTVGSANPMLSGVALSCRLGDHLVARLPPPALEDGFSWLFDGTAASFSDWVQVGPGRMVLDDAEGALIAEPGAELGLCVYGGRGFGDFVLRLQFRVAAAGDNSGVFVRCRDPRLGPIDRRGHTSNPAWLAVETGFEVQIADATATAPADRHRTGAVYDIPTAGHHHAQAYARGSALRAGMWNDYEITVTGDAYEARLNGHTTATFVNADRTRGVSSRRDVASGFLGLQQHTGGVAFRAVRIRELEPCGATRARRPAVARAAVARSSFRQSAPLSGHVGASPGGSATSKALSVNDTSV